MSSGPRRGGPEGHMTGSARPSCDCPEPCAAGTGTADRQGGRSVAVAGIAGFPVLDPGERQRRAWRERPGRRLPQEPCQLRVAGYRPLAGPGLGTPPGFAYPSRLPSPTRTTCPLQSASWRTGSGQPSPSSMTCCPPERRTRLPAARARHEVTET